MKNLLGLVVSITLFAFTGSAQAVPMLIDFKALGNAAEAGHDPLSLPAHGLTVTGLYTGDDSVWAYLDGANSGLGVCRELSNCGPDDNVDVDEEVLRFVFDPTVQITKIWFNNNHDPDGELAGDTITINGMDITFTAVTDQDTTRGDDYFYDTPFSAGASFDIAYYTGPATDGRRAEEFYVSAIEYDDDFPGGNVPEPLPLMLIAMGFIGMALARRRNRAV